jgi:nucleoside-diphosphate-sugar epimerase
LRDESATLYGNGRQRRACTYTGDSADATLLAILVSQAGMAVNVGGDSRLEQATNAEIS